MSCHGIEIDAETPYGPELLAAVATAEDAIARLDERLRSNPVRDGFNARAHFHDACAGLCLAGELVHLEDLVLHDAEMDLRAPTHELTRAHALLRARRRIAVAPPGAALSRGLKALRERDRGGAGRDEREKAGDMEPEALQAPLCSSEADGALLAAELAAIDAAIERSNHVLANGRDAAPRERDEPGRELVYDSEHDEEALFAEWRRRVEAASRLPPTLAAAMALESWRELSPAEHDSGLGAQLVADLLRLRGKARAHLPCVNVGLRAIPFESRRRAGRGARLSASLAALKSAADWGLAECDRLATARARLERRCRGRRGNSRLPLLADLMIAKPFVTANMAAAELGVSARAALDMMAALDVRELTGRGRFRAWGI
jgi:hypothetical protein